MSNEVTTTGANALALPDDLRAELMQEAKDAAAEERPSVSKLSTQGGTLTYQGQPLPNNEMEAIILGAVHRNVYYSGPFNPNDIKNPDCFALSEDGEDMAPHENVSAPVHQTCEGCTFNEWKSDPRPGSKGKACKQSRRMILIPASAAADVATLQKAEKAILDLPVTSGKNYANFVNATAASTGLPPYAVVARITVERDPKTQFKVNITPVRVAGEADVIRALRDLKDDAVRLGLTPYDETSPSNSAVSPEQKAAQQKMSKKVGG